MEDLWEDCERLLLSHSLARPLFCFISLFVISHEKTEIIFNQMEKFFLVCQLFAAYLLSCWCMACGVVRVKTQGMWEVPHGCWLLGSFLLFRLCSIDSTWNPAALNHRYRLTSFLAVLRSSLSFHIIHHMISAQSLSHPPPINLC